LTNTFPARDPCGRLWRFPRVLPTAIDIRQSRASIVGRFSVPPVSSHRGNWL